MTQAAFGITTTAIQASQIASDLRQQGFVNDEISMLYAAGLLAEIGYVLVAVAVVFLVIALLTGRGPAPPIG